MRLRVWVLLGINRCTLFYVALRYFYSESLGCNPKLDKLHATTGHISEDKFSPNTPKDTINCCTLLGRGSFLYIDRCITMYA